MRRLVVSPQAEIDLLEIWVYFAQESEQAAETVNAKITGMFDQLLVHPYMGRERADIRPRLRSFSVGSYVIFYSVMDDGIEVIRVLHGARDIENIL